MKVNEKKTILVVSGLDPSGHAGIIVDIETVLNLKCHPCAIVATSTLQNKDTVTGAYAMDDSIFYEQLQRVIENERINTVKIGLLVTRKSAQILSSSFSGKNIPIVYDPVYQSSSGYFFSREEEFLGIAEELSKIATLITPNRLEAETLSKISINDDSDFTKAASKIVYRNILIKGGHFEKKNRDFLYSQGKSEWIEGTRNPFSISRGTGCRLSTAIVCFIAKGNSLKTSIAKAKAYLEAC